MNETAKRIKLIVDRGLSPLLKQSGFRKNGTHYSKKDGEALQVINVQSSQWNTSSSGRFTLNVGVHFSEVSKILRGTDAMRDPPKEYCCLMRRRVGELMPEGADHWWTVKPGTDVEALAEELVTTCKDYVFPWLERVRTISGAASEMERSRWLELWTAAGARLVLGEREKASQLTETMIDSWRKSPNGSADLKAKRIKELRDWAAGHNLPGFVKSQAL